MKNFDNRAHKAYLLTHSLTHSLTHPLTDSLTNSLRTYFLFDLGLKQSIHICWLFLWDLTVKISDKNCLKRYLISDIVVIFIHYKMINLDSITNENNKKHNEKWPYIPDHP